MRLFLLFLFIASTIFISCKGDETYKDYSKFSKKRWYNDKPKIFEFNNDGLEASIKPSFLFRFVKGTQVTDMTVGIEVTLPSKTIINKKIDFKLNREGCLGDICDMTIAIDTKLDLREKGLYSFKLTNLNPGKYTPNIMYVGVLIP